MTLRLYTRAAGSLEVFLSQLDMTVFGQQVNFTPYASESRSHERNLEIPFHN